MKAYKRYRYPHTIISHAVWLYHRFTLSFRDIEELLAYRGNVVTYETIRQWCLKLTPSFVQSIKKKQGSLDDRWFLDEVFIKINGKQHYLWRAVDQDGCELDILLTKKCDKEAAIKFFKKLLKGHSRQSRKITTDKLPSYKSALRYLGCNTPHITDRYQNNIAEISHQKTRQQQRHLLKAKHYRLLRDQAFDKWAQVTCAQNLQIA